MANTFTQMHMHVVFATKYREACIFSSWEDQLYRFITTVIQAQGHKVLQINGLANHIHILLAQRPNQDLSSIVQKAKEESTKFINQKRFTRKKFAWQQGFAAFCVARANLPAVISYIQHQKKHHQKKSFLQEYREFLELAGIEYDPKYLFVDPV